MWVTSTPTRVLYMMTEDTNTEERSRFTAAYWTQLASVTPPPQTDDRILLMMLHRVHTPMARRARKTALLWMRGCMRSDSRVWTRM